VEARIHRKTRIVKLRNTSLDEIRSHGHALTPGRYVGVKAAEDDDESFTDKMERLIAKLEEQFAESAKLEATIAATLKDLRDGK